MNQLKFETLKKAWDKLKKNRASDLRALVPDLTDPSEIYIKRISEDDAKMVVEFGGFREAMLNQKSIPQMKGTILSWLRKIVVGAQQGRSGPETLVVHINKEMKFDEAAVAVFKRDPKTNKKKTQYRCIGGKKDGRKVSDPSNCIGVPDPSKKIKFAVTKRAKYGQASASKKRTQLTNITARRIRKANQRLKKARGF